MSRILRPAGAVVGLIALFASCTFDTPVSPASTLGRVVAARSSDVDVAAAPAIVPPVAKITILGFLAWPITASYEARTNIRNEIQLLQHRFIKLPFRDSLSPLLLLVRIFRLIEARQLSGIEQILDLPLVEGVGDDPRQASAHLGLLAVANRLDQQVP